MKIALVTDQHFGARNDSQKIAQHMKQFYDNVFFPYIDKHNIDTVINLGAVSYTHLTLPTTPYV